MFIFSAIGEIFGHPVALRLRRKAMSCGKAGASRQKPHSASMHGVAEPDEGLVHLGETDQSLAGIFHLKRGINRCGYRYGEGDHVEPAPAMRGQTVTGEEGTSAA